MTMPIPWKHTIYGGKKMDDDRLTTRENKISEYAQNGATNREIAEQLGISVRTVETHMKNIHAKLGVRDRTWLRSVMGNLG